MKKDQFPLDVARAMLSILPPPAASAAARIGLRLLARQHPRLFKTLAAYKPAMIGITPTDLPHSFFLRYGGGPMTLTARTRLAQSGDTPTPDAAIKGSLASLIALLEGRIDSDAAFFSRELIVTGNTEAIVTLRNVLEREEIALFSASLSLFGPAQPLARRLVRGLDHALGRARRRAVLRHEALHAERKTPSPSFGRVERLEHELRAFTTRLARLEAQSRRREVMGRKEAS